MKISKEFCEERIKDLKTFLEGQKEHSIEGYNIQNTDEDHTSTYLVQILKKQLIEEKR